MKKVIELVPKQKRKSVPTYLLILAGLIVAAFVLLLIVGFENVLAVLRYRVTMFLIIGPLCGLFLWCAYKAFGPQNRS